MVVELGTKTVLELYEQIHKHEGHWNNDEVICGFDNARYTKANTPDWISNKKDLIAESTRFATENEVLLKSRWVSLDLHNAVLKELEAVAEKLTKTTFTNFAQGKKEGYDQRTEEFKALLAEQRKVTQTEIEDWIHGRDLTHGYRRAEGKLELLVLLEAKMT